MKREILTGLLLDEAFSLTSAELSLACAVHAEWIVALVDEGILEPIGQDATHWRFSGSSLNRAHRQASAAGSGHHSRRRRAGARYAG